jgi:hypothetical protein
VNDAYIELLKNAPDDVKAAARKAAARAARALCDGWNSREFKDRILGRIFSEVRSISEDDLIERCKAAGFFPPDEVIKREAENTYIEHILRHYGFVQKAERDTIYWGLPAGPGAGEGEDQP